MEHTLGGIRWCYEYQNGNIWLNDDCIAVNSQERVLSIIVKKIIECQFMSKTFIKTLIMNAVVSVAARHCAILSSEYYIQSIRAKQIIYAISFI